MKRSKIKLFFAVLFCAVLSLPLFVFAGCQENDNVPKGELYQLKVAYEMGLLTKDDLEQIAYYNNNNIDCPESLEEPIAKAIKEAEAERLRTDKANPLPEAKAEGVTIHRYYGCYSGNYAVKTSNCYVSYLTDVPDIREEIGGVEFHFTDYYFVCVLKLN
ncbi:MAG: hypothetical protein K2N14_00260, partial [Clostridia bacterium]|nr:hypothetical protein [Clostridia bacterium]